MTDEARNIVLPQTFLPVVERYNLAMRLHRWVIARALRWLVSHLRRVEALELGTTNISGQSLGNAEFVDKVVQLIDESGLPPEKICFEIAETAAFANLASAIGFMRQLQARGCRFALDDFGSGFSSFAYLKTLPVDFLKIDSAFVSNMVDDPMDLAMVRSINEIGQVTGKKTIAGFVENEAILAEVRKIGVDYVLGYGAGYPHRQEG